MLYLVTSHAFPERGVDFSKVRDKSYIFSFKLKVSGKTIKAVQKKKYTFYAKKKVSWVNGRKKNKGNRRLEMEDLYYYNNTFFINSEGGRYLCVDLVGTFDGKR